jgi:hypothetical protein
LFNRTQPTYEQSWRWWLAVQSASGLLISALLLLAAFALLITGVYELTRTDSAHPFLLIEWLTVFQAVLGGNALAAEADNPIHAALGAVTSVVGALAPALFIGVVFIRMFSVRPFTWRRTASISLASQADDPDYARRHARSADAIIAVRFYNRQHNMTIVDLRCQVYLRYLQPSAGDHSLVYVKVPLLVLDGKGEEKDERFWPSLEPWAPFTVWIPVGAPVPDLPFRVIQGKRIPNPADAKLLIRLTASAVGLGTEIVEEQWYDLNNPTHFRLGRFFPIFPDAATKKKKEAMKWPGWDRFDGDLRHSVFIYGTLLNLGELASLLGHAPVEGVDYVRARLTGYRHAWNGTMEFRPGDTVIRPRGADGLPPTLQLVLNAEPSAGRRVEGILLPVDAKLLLAIEARTDHSTQMRVTVTRSVEYDAEPPGGRPDVIYTHITERHAVHAAEVATADGTAAICDPYFSTLGEGARQHDARLRASYEGDELQLPGTAARDQTHPDGENPPAPVPQP